MRKAIELLASVGLSLMVIVFVIRSGHIDLVFFAVAVALIGISRVTRMPAPMKGVFAVLAIAVAGAITGLVARFDAPIGEFGFGYLVLV